MIWTKRQSPLFCSDRSALWHANYLHPPTPKKSGTVNQITQGLDLQTRFILDLAGAKKVGHRQSNNSKIRRSITIYTCTCRTPKKSGTASLILELYIWKKNRAPDHFLPRSFSLELDFFRWSPIRTDSLWTGQENRGFWCPTFLDLVPDFSSI